MTSLSSVHPDYADIVAQLQAKLATDSAWKDLVISSTGQSLVEMVAMVGELDQYAIEQQLRQAFIDSAVTQNAVLAHARTLGVRLRRRVPAQMTVRIQSKGAGFTLSAYTAFDCNGVTLFNRAAYTVPSYPSSLDITLYEGVVQSKDLSSNGTDFQMFRSNEASYTVSDDDTVVIASGIPVPVTKKGIWEYPNANAVADATTVDGELLLTFGSSQYGFKPVLGQVVTVRYVVTSGKDANDSTLTGATVTPVISLNASLTATTGLYGGGDPWNTNTIRRLSPMLFAASERATTETDLVAVASTYPGVIDVSALGQHKIAPMDVKYMNAVQLSVLTESSWTNNEWNDFVGWLTSRALYPIRFYRRDPKPYNVDITAAIYCKATAELGVVDNLVRAALTAMFEKQSGILGRNVFRSDIHRTVMASSQDILYLELNAPTKDILIEPEIAHPAISELHGGGLATDSFNSYAITVFTANGESKVKAYLGCVVEGLNNAIKIEWDPVAQALGYGIYGRGPVTYGLLAKVTDPSFIDDGTLTPQVLAPTADSAGVFYPVLGTVNLTVRYSDRV